MSLVLDMVVLDRSRLPRYDMLYDIPDDIYYAWDRGKLMARYPLNLPLRLKQEAEKWAANQGVSLNQFILWSVAEKVGALKQDLDDP